jgi:flagellar biosynthetic protein FliP
MSPIFLEINDKGLKPYLNKEISQEEAFKNIVGPLKKFMLKHTKEKELKLFISLTTNSKLKTREDVPFLALLSAFIISELNISFQMGIIIFLPFLVIDMVVASTLMSMGMMMLPPVMISLPFKLLLFILVDGWNLVIESLVKSFR